MDTKDPTAQEPKPQTTDVVAPAPAPAPAPENSLPANDVAGIKAEDDVAQNEPHATDTPQKTHNTAIAAVAMAIVVAIGLGGIGTMAYMNAKNKVQPASNSEVKSPTPKVSADDIQKTIDDVNTSIKTINDDEDFGENDLTDATLGLQ